MSTLLGVKARSALEELSSTGAFKRTASIYRDFISKDGKFQPEANRYHLYISHACPWANRCNAVRVMKGLEDIISLSVVHPTWNRTKPHLDDDHHKGWTFAAPNVALKSSLGYGSFAFADTEEDPILGAKSIREIYESVDDNAGKYTVPILYDKNLKVIVNNESSEIVQMFNSAFNDLAKNPGLDLFPSHLKESIDMNNEWIYNQINDGVYCCGFATTQSSYDEAVKSLFEGLDRLEKILGKNKFVCGSTFTITDIRLWQTLVRFDEVYVVYFKCDVKKIAEYENIMRYCRDIWKINGIKETTHMDHIKTHYYTSHSDLNKYAIIPAGPMFLFSLETFAM